jgi:hypothetical protein
MQGTLTEELSMKMGTFTAIGLAAIAVSAGLAYSAKADVVLPVQNLEFNQFTGTFTPPKTLFTTAAPTNWFIGTTIGISSNLIGVGNQGSEGSSAGVYAVYDKNTTPPTTGPGFSNTVPAGTNFFQADGNPMFESTIAQNIPNLTAGTTYDLSFQQAAGQQVGFTGATTEQWKVFLGVGGIGLNCTSPMVANTCDITGTANNVEVDSALMNTPSMGNVDWNFQQLAFTLGSNDLLSNGSAVLTFLAWGNGGSTVNEPPTVFLEGVNTTPVTTPEPASLSLIGAGLLGLAGIVRRRRGKRNAAV